MDKSLINTIYDLSLAADEARREVDVLSVLIKEHAREEELNLAAFLAANAGDQYKQWSSSSTPSNVRKAIEAGIMARCQYIPLYDITQEQISLAAAEQHYRNLRSELTMYTMRFYAEFAEAFGTLKKAFSVDQLHDLARSVLPVAPSPVVTRPWE